MTTEAFTVRAESNLVTQLDHLADTLDRSRNYIVNQALKECLERHAWQIEKIGQGITAADCGEWVDHEVVMKEMEELIEGKVKVKV